jgi:hypothetical protein
MMANFIAETEPSTFHHKVGHGDGSTFSINVDIEDRIPTMTPWLFDNPKLLEINRPLCLELFKEHLEWGRDVSSSLKFKFNCHANVTPI